MNQESLVEYGSRRVIITITAIMCALLEIVDATIVNVALNDMKGNLGATLNEIGWVITAYAIGNVIIVPMTSWLSQQFGRRNYFAASIIIFTVASFLCGNSTNLWELVLFRFIQGLGGGALLVTSQTIITEVYPPEKRGMAQAIYGLGVIIGPTLGPPLGGYIVENFSWPYIFYINLPLGIIAASLTLQFVRSPKYGEKQSARQIDWAGIAFLAIAVSSLQYILERGQEDDWFSSPVILALAVTSAISFYLFIWREWICENPIVDLHVLRNGNLRIGTILSFILGFGLYGSTFIIPMYLQTSLWWNAQQAGMIMIPAALVTAFMMPVIGKLIQKGIKPYYMAAAGMFFFFLYSIWGSKIISPVTGEGDFFWMLMLRGLAMSMLFIPITTMSLSTLKGQDIGKGASFTGMMRQLGGSFGIAIITTFMSHQNAQHRADLVVNMTAENVNLAQRQAGLTYNMMQHGMAPNQASAAANYVLDMGVMGQASILTYRDVFLYIGIMFLLCVPFILMIRSGKTKVDMSEAMH